MRHEITSANTKKAIAASLKKKMAQKPLSKITVSEIIADCGVNRKTFYYHFEDIYALLKWMLEEEAIEVVKGFDLLVEPEEAITFVIDYVNANQHILCCAYDSMGREEMKRFFYADLIDVTGSIVEGVEQELGISTPDNFKKLLIAFYTEAMVGMLVDYFQAPEKYSREDLIRDLLFILQHSIPNILKDRSIAL